MGRVIKYLFYLVILVLVILFAYSFVGDLSAPTETITQAVEPNAN